MTLLLRQQSVPDDHYRVFVECENCGFRGHLDIPHQHAVTHYGCPTCRCYWLHRTNPTRWDAAPVEAGHDG